MSAHEGALGAPPSSSCPQKARGGTESPPKSRKPAVAMRFEEILEDVGGFSKFQLLVLGILCIPRAILPLHFLLHNFASATPAHHCAPGPAAGPNSSRPDAGTQSSCGVDDRPTGGNLTQESRPGGLCPQGYVYDQSQFSSTTATEVSPSPPLPL